jgi:hypothetical protein
MEYINLSEEEKAFLASQGITPERFPDEDDLWEEIYGVMLDHIVGNNDEPDKIALKLERIYDRAIYE